MEIICRFYPIAYYIYVFGQCLVGFGYIAVVSPFEITEIIWRSDTELELPGTTSAVRFPENNCIECSAANQIQAFSGTVV